MTIKKPQCRQLENRKERDGFLRAPTVTVPQDRDCREFIPRNTAHGRGSANLPSQQEIGITPAAAVLLRS